MIKRNFDELAVYSLDVQKEQVLFDEVKNLFIKNTTEIIYFVIDRRVFGIICLGDCLRKGDGHYIKINTEFTYIIDWNMMRAKDIFLKNSQINKIPIVNEKHILLGEYSRWDDKWTIKHFISSDVMKLLIKEYECNKKIYVVNSESMQSESRTFWDSKTVQVIDKYEVGKCLNEKSVFIFETEDERRALECYYGQRYPNFFTWVQIYEKYVKRDVLVLCLQMLKQQEISIYLLGNYNENCELQEACASQPANWAKQEKEKYWKDFLEELYTEQYSEQLDSMQFVHKNVNGIRTLQDTNSGLLNIKNGNRKTCYQPDKYRGTIWFFGPCIIAGAFVEDKNTIESYLQKRLVEGDYDYRVVNCGAWEDVTRVLMNATQIKKGDVIVLYTGGARYKGFLNISLEDIYIRNNIPVKWASGHLHHCNHKVNELIADELFMKIIPNLPSNMNVAVKNVCNAAYNVESIKLKLIKETYINIYFNDYIREKCQRIGAVVMNCNPFTQGHRYLIERAVEQVELLILFVVQENSSLFSFEERFEMVKEGVSDLSNVRVVPSGKFILSHMTFPEYFNKVKTDDLETDIEYDLRLWGECIASVLGIHYRFVGEENEDIVTAAYNTTMKKVLPEYGINVIEIPRKKLKGRCISASYVRELLERKEYKDAFSLIPLSTRRVLEKQL